MKKFAFRLQVVLDRACAEEEEQLRHLAKLQEEVAQIDRQIAMREEHRRQLLAVLMQQQQGRFDPREAAAGRLQLGALAAEVQRLRDERAQADARVQTQRQAVVAAMRRRQSLEKLREQALATYRRGVEKEELRTMEEAVLPRLARERAGGPHGTNR